MRCARTSIRSLAFPATNTPRRCAPASRRSPELIAQRHLAQSPGAQLRGELADRKKKVFIGRLDQRRLRPRRAPARSSRMCWIVHRRGGGGRRRIESPVQRVSCSAGRQQIEAQLDAADIVVIRHAMGGIWPRPRWRRCGRPSRSSSIGALPEIIEDVTGVLCEPVAARLRRWLQAAAEGPISCSDGAATIASSGFPRHREDACREVYIRYEVLQGDSRPVATAGRTAINPIQHSAGCGARAFAATGTEVTSTLSRAAKR